MQFYTTKAHTFLITNNSGFGKNGQLLFRIALIKPMFMFMFKERFKYKKVPNSKFRKDKQKF